MVTDRIACARHSSEVFRFHKDGSALGANLRLLLNESRRRMGPRWAEQVVVMSSSHGHLNCNVTTADGWHVPHLQPLASTHDYPLMSRVARDVAGEYGVTWLDITSPLATRDDGHMPTECGHWCLPGPYDLGAQLLYNALVGQIRVPASRMSSRHTVRRT